MINLYLKLIRNALDAHCRHRVNVISLPSAIPFFLSSFLFLLFYLLLVYLLYLIPHFFPGSAPERVKKLKMRPVVLLNKKYCLYATTIKYTFQIFNVSKTFLLLNNCYNSKIKAHILDFFSVDMVKSMSHTLI